MVGLKIYTLRMNWEQASHNSFQCFSTRNSLILTFGPFIKKVWTTLTLKYNNKV